jgi:hypothetical protein
LDPSQEIFSLQGVAIPRPHWPGGYHQLKASSQGYLAGRQDLLARLGNPSNEIKP